ncbi:radical SAM protein, partial [Candidatus Parcubacteria bacterium]|nr:radical SAM protein [Candidatus Parcubacteria bacterium]
QAKLGGQASPRTGEGRLAGLIKKLIKIKDLGRIRLSSIEVTEVSDELIKLMAVTNLPSLKLRQASKICRHLHIPLQSGCNKILKLMNRPYDVKYYKNKIKKIKKAMPDIAVTTDVIVGFPDETKKNFKETYNFIKEMQFSRLHVFPFSAHEKTQAVKMERKVSEHEIKKRANKLRKLGKKLEMDYRKKFNGKELEVVVESASKDKIKGKAEYYFDVEFSVKQITIDLTKISANIIGKIVKVKI